MGVDRTGSDRGTAGRRLARGGGLLAALTLLAMAAAPRPAPAAEPAPAAAGMTTVISAGSLWRKHYTFAPPRLSVAAAQALGLKTDAVSRTKALEVQGDSLLRPLAKFYLRGVIPLETPPPPESWAAADFDDSGWIHAPGIEFEADCLNYPADSQDVFQKPPSPDGSLLTFVRCADVGVWEVQLVCMRGRFLVKDRAAVKKLRFSLTYRGGFIARLNGTEIARGALPPGAVAPDAAAEEYPANASLTYAASRRGGAGADTRPDSQQYWPLRERRGGPVDVNPALLRDGLNLLTLEMHRSDYPAECKEIRLGFTPVGLSELFLEADAPAGNFVGSTRPPAGLRVWNAETWEPVLLSDYGDPVEPLGPIVIVGARNGSFSGQVVVGATAAIVGLQAKADALKKKGGGGEIPSASWRMRYGAVNPTRTASPFALATGLIAPRFDMLLEAPPARAAPAAAATIAGWSGQIRQSLGLPEKAENVAAVPVWVTVQVPGTAGAGDYEGSLTVTAQGAPPVTVPVQLHVADWTLPDVKDYGSVLFVYQSPDTLAEYYKVAPWSPAHWRLIDRSLTLLGEASNAGLILPLMAESQHGNAESLVLWIKKADGTYAYDFTNFDKYVETALKHHDPKRLKAVELDVWGRQAEVKDAGALVTLLDPATGAKSQMKLPDYGTAECEALWRPLLLAVRERLQKAGVADKIMLGMPTDPAPPPSHVAMFRNILPDAPWMREDHHAHVYWRDSAHPALPYDPAECDALGYDRYKMASCKKVVPVGLTSTVYGHIIWYGPLPDPKRQRLYGWRREPDRPFILSYNRCQSATLALNGFASPWPYHMWMESSLVGGWIGNGRVGGDYFRMGGGTLFLRYPASVPALGHNLTGSTPDLLAPGPDGAVTTVRFENARAGIQESEARIFLEKALLNKDKPLPADLAKRCQELLDARTRAMQTGNLNWTWGVSSRGDTAFGMQDWQKSCRSLFDLAAEAAKVSQAPAAAP